MTQEPWSDLSPAPSPAEPVYRLARIWNQKGEIKRAIHTLQRALEQDLDHAAAHCLLGYLLLEQADVAAAADCLVRVLELRPEAETVRGDLDFLRKWMGHQAQAGEPLPPAALPHNPAGKIKFHSTKSVRGHRSGWPAAMASLQAYHNNHGVLFDGFLEELFAWRHRRSGTRPVYELLRLHRDGSYAHEVTAEELGMIPFREPWVGFMHNPPNMPSWFHPEESPQAIMNKRVWHESLPTCLGFFALSEYQGRWLRGQTGKPVSVLTHPTEIPEQQFDFERFLDNPQKKIVQVGWWLRRLHGLAHVPLAGDNALGYEKVRLVPHFIENADAYLRQLMAKERKEVGCRTAGGDVREVQHLSNMAYDELLAKNILFLHLHDAGANNTVVECIARATPLLVNPLPAVVEYLGPDYPLYYRDWNEAATFALDTGRLQAAHVYLQTCPTRENLSYEQFRNSFLTSEVYGLL